MTVLCKASWDFSESFVHVSSLGMSFPSEEHILPLSGYKRSLSSPCQCDTEEVHVTRRSLPATGCCFLPLSSWWYLNVMCRVYLERGRSHFSQGCFCADNCTVSLIATMFHTLAKCFYNTNSELSPTLKQLLYYSVCLLPRSINRWLSIANKISWHFMKPSLSKPLIKVEKFWYALSLDTIASVCLYLHFMISALTKEKESYSFCCK